MPLSWQEPERTQGPTYVISTWIVIGMTVIVGLAWATSSEDMLLPPVTAEACVLTEQIPLGMDTLRTMRIYACAEYDSLLSEWVRQP